MRSTLYLRNCPRYYTSGAQPFIISLLNNIVTQNIKKIKKFNFFIPKIVNILKVNEKYLV